MTTPANPARGTGAAARTAATDRARAEPAAPDIAVRPPGVRHRPPGARPARICPRPQGIGLDRPARYLRGDPGEARGGYIPECAEPSPMYRGGYTRRPVRVDDPGELIAALPAMVGFYPHRSLLVAVLGPPVAPGASSGIAAVVRFDLDPPGGRRGSAAAFADCVRRICAAEGARETLAVIVDDRMDPPPPGAHSGHVVIADLMLHLGGDGIRVRGAWAATAIEEGGAWWSVRGPVSQGELPDPTASTVALAHVLDGRPILRSRTELTAIVRPDAARVAEVSAALGDALGRARDRLAAAVRHDDVTGYRRRALEYVLWQVACAGSGTIPAAREIAEVLAALRDRTVRDAMFALAAGDHAADAERLWVTLVRAAPGRDRAEAGALLGYSAYLRGDGPLAGIALESALDADPDHTIAMLLDTALRAGMRPEQLRRLARTGHDTAALLGIDLGPVRT
ncbi:DUF4192 domain-containing protein [Nocardia puris]|uniref:Uncharacterized protein DUF4192 n=1 Tax=Nocardia puris TaxID=208602 RepID=A0A366E4Y3_9NOCA|nr:DUF4192 domain-containing protein [Nocardia puris]RBO96458.1 uncharacterized protein DUF4192 [Nocardia puris]